LVLSIVVVQVVLTSSSDALVVAPSSQVELHFRLDLVARSCVHTSVSIIKYLLVIQHASSLDLVVIYLGKHHSHVLVARIHTLARPACND